ncbi:MAG: hydrogenase maturation nickel metallochaperone HypA [Nitrosomonadales bacterium]|nr:hydrogenase maturation nickel metallochaperone HypA [Nitrosomonadales bacterium]
MHEMSLAESVLQLIEDEARNQGFSRVKTVCLEIGQLACVEKESMRFCFDAVVHGSIAERAQLEIIETAGQGICASCALEQPIVALHEACSNCGSHEIRVICGDAMRVIELVVE